MTALFLIACAAGLYLAGAIIDMAKYKRHLESLERKRWPRIDITQPVEGVDYIILTASETTDKAS